MTEAPKILLAHHLKTLKLPTVLREHEKVARQCAAEGLDPNEALQIGGQYVPLLQYGQELHISGQIPRVGSEVVVCGRVGDSCSEAAAQRAARIACLRALVLLYQHLGSLERVARILRLNVYVQSAADFTGS